jgi:hypothetical protein
MVFAQYCECTKSNRIVHFKMVNFILCEFNCVSIKMIISYLDRWFDMAE